ncbi:MAG: hypothetical protein ACQESR_03715 [Planctomycetota bacterium]
MRRGQWVLTPRVPVSKLSGFPVTQRWREGVWQENVWPMERDTARLVAAEFGLMPIAKGILRRESG